MFASEEKYLFAFSEHSRPKKESLLVVKEIWVTLVHTIKGEYDVMKGDSDLLVFRKQEVFRKRQERMKVFCMVNGCIRWSYQPLL